MRRLTTVLILLLTAGLSGCGWTASDLPLPGGGLSGPSYELKAEFADVLNLPEKAKVTMDGVEIGQVTDIEVEGYTATVTLAILEEFRLPKATTLELRQATALGEVFVAVNAPEDSGSGYFEAGDTIPVGNTGSAPSIEDTLGALSALINGGGLRNLKTIMDEADKVFRGRIPEARHLLGALRDLMATVRGREDAINQVLGSMDSLTRQVLADRPAIDGLLDEVGPAIKELSRQRQQFVTMLSRFQDLARSGVSLIGGAQEHVLRLLDRLGPTLDGFAAIDHDLAPALEDMVEFYRAAKRVTQGNSATLNFKLLGARVGGTELP